MRGVGFGVSQGERVALLGANASGKSTLMHLMNGLYFAEVGGISAFGTVLTDESVETPLFSRTLRQRMGFLFQNSDAQLFCPTVGEELAFGPLQLRLPLEEIECRVADTLRLFGLEHLKERSPQTLSGGEKKKVALAGLITCGPSVILLDEPSSGLDPRSRQWLTEFLNALSSAGTTLIISTHDLGFAADTSDRALILAEDHKLVYDGLLSDALSDLDMLLSANLIHAHTHRHEDGAHTHPHLHEIMHEHKH